MTTHTLAQLDPAARKKRLASLDGLGFRCSLHRPTAAVVGGAAWMLAAAHPVVAAPRHEAARSQDVDDLAWAFATPMEAGDGSTAAAV